MKRNIGIDLLRGFSILYIVGYWHMLEYTRAVPHFNNFFTHSLVAVVLGVFVLISGYLIGSKNLSLDIRSLGRFYGKRLLRIYPLYILAMELFLHLRMMPRATAIKAFYLTSMFWKPAPPTLWFITMILLLYVVAPLLVVASRSLRPSIFLLWCLVVLFSLMAYSHFTGRLDDRLPYYFPAFALGIFAASRAEDLIVGKFPIAVALGICIGLSFIRTSVYEVNLLLGIPLVTVCPYLLFQVAKKIRVSSAPVRKSILFLSYASYCMYLFHRPIYISFVTRIFPSTPAMQLLYLVAVCLPCVVVSGFLIQKLYDFCIDRVVGLVWRKKCPNVLP